jgi:hypothetical protein
MHWLRLRLVRLSMLPTVARQPVLRPSQPSRFRSFRPVTRLMLLLLLLLMMMMMIYASRRGFALRILP